MEKMETGGEYVFLDIVEDSKEVCKMVLEKALVEEKINLEELRKNEELLHRLFVILKINYKISLRDIAINFKINREKVRKIFNKK